MCLVTNQKTAIIAEKDITVYKILGKDLNAIFTNFKYVIGKINETEIKHSEKWYCLGIIDEEYLNKKYPPRWRRHPDLICLGEGFHSFETEEIAKIVNDYIYKHVDNIFKCVIPKGSEYYINEVGFIVSNSLIIKEKVNE